MSNHKIERVFGVFPSTAFVVGTVVGTGIYLKPGLVAELLGSPWRVLWVWFAGGVFVTAGAVVYSRLARLWPESGGAYLYLSRVYGPWAASLLLAADVFIGRPAAVGALAYGLGLVWQLEASRCLVVALSAVVVLTAVQLMGSRVQGLSQSVLTFFQFLPLLVAVGLAGILPAATMEVSAPTVSVASPAWGAAFLAVLWAYDGWYNLTNMAGEVEDPERNLPKAMVFGMAFVTLLYVALNASLIQVLGLDSLAGDGLPVLTLFERSGVPFLTAGLQLFLSLALITTLNGTLACGSRVLIAASTDGLIRRRLGSDPTAAAPTLAFSAMCLGFLLFSGGLPLKNNMFDTLSELTAVVVLALSSLTVTCLFQIHSRGQATTIWERGAGALFLVINAILTVFLVMEVNLIALTGVAVVGGIGTVLWAFRRRPLET